LRSAASTGESSCVISGSNLDGCSGGEWAAFKYILGSLKEQIDLQSIATQKWLKPKGILAIMAIVTAPVVVFDVDQTGRVERVERVSHCQNRTI